MRGTRAAEDAPAYGVSVARELLSAARHNEGLYPRILGVFAHPDDEVLALGGRMELLLHSRLLCATDGAPADGADARAHDFSTLAGYREARRAEVRAVLRQSGLPEDLSRPLLILDNEGERFQIADQTAALHLPGLARAIAGEIRTFAPQVVITHPYEGGHPDHDSCAFAVRWALRLLRRGARPRLLEAAFYHAGEGGIETGTFLGNEWDAQPEAIWTCELTLEQQQRKVARLRCFATQGETLAQFGTERERFRLAPVYDFRQPPHAGALFYEGFPWGMEGDRFRHLASAAMRELAPEAEPVGPEAV